MIYLRRILFALFYLAASTSAADPGKLESWGEWVKQRHDDFNCPWRLSQKQERACVWPGQLALSFSDQILSFRFSVDVFSDHALMALPGDSIHWPQAVLINGESAQLVEKDGIPHVSLQPGSHVLAGRFTWQQNINSLAVPASIAFVTLEKAGRQLATDRRGNQIIFSDARKKADARTRDSLSVEVYRLLTDGVPLTMETLVKLSVSGKSREVSLGRLLMGDSVISGIDARLPARVEPDGSLRVQIIAGEHYIRVLSRFPSNVSEIRAQRTSELWPAIEYLSFQADTNTRQANLSGAVSVDTTQVPVPPGWAELPTYRLDSDSVLRIDSTYRGDHSPLANQLSVKRDLWLDFSGSALTTLDSITGRMYQGWRLSAKSDTAIGRATVEGVPVLITEEAGRQGIEVRSPNINLSAVTRVQSPGAFSASGWDARADSFLATLHLPPGWRVLHASGVDGISGTWLSKWDLWDIFLLLIMVAATKKLLGFKPAVLSAFALLIGYHESGAPIATIPVLLLVIALLTILAGRWKRSASIFGAVTTTLLVIGVVAFAVSAFRLAIYPTLEKGQVGRYQASSYEPGLNRVSGVSRDSLAAPKESEFAADREEKVQVARKKNANLYEVDDNDRVQTGPGLPNWLWNRVNLRSTGPVAADQELSIYYCPPWLTALWRIASVFLFGAYAALLVFRFARLTDFKATSRPLAASGTVGMLVAVMVGMSWNPPAMADEFPPKYLLDELDARMMKPPPCLPSCASINNGRLVADETSLDLSFDLYADADIALPIPSGNDGWRISRIEVNGIGSTPAAIHQRQTLLRIEKGHHKVRIVGSVLGDQIAISFPMAIHNFTLEAKPWLVEGLLDGRIPNKILNFSARAKNLQAREATLIPDPVKPFVIVHREFVLGKRWSMITRVQRLAPTQGPLAVSVALLPFEKVLTDSLAIKEGAALVQFGSRQQEISWQSSMSPTNNLSLVAADTSTYIETWRLSPSSLWRLDHSGIPPVKEANQISTLQPFWKPWPGETLTLAISRPQGIVGPTHTVEAATLTYNAGRRLQKSQLSLDIRASIGDNYTVIFPDDAEILSVVRDGNVLNLPDSPKLTVPLEPGMQQLTVVFQEHNDLGWYSKTPEIQLSGDTSNIGVRFELPRDRWPLYVSGPDIGPAMLYWGMLCVVVLGAVILNQLATRLSFDIPVTLVGWLLLGVGLSTVNVYGALIVAVFFFLLAARKQVIDPDSVSRRGFNLLQFSIIVWSIITALAVISAIPLGLLSNPDMKVVGNNSYSHLYNFYQDRSSDGSLPSVGVLSVSILTYRVVMLVWSLWLATRIIQWAQWWWNAYSAGGTWKPAPEPKAKVEPSE